jgi:hypothetical protein
LFLVRGVGWQRCDVPVNVSISLVTTEGEDVDSLGVEFEAESFGECVDEPLSVEVFVEREVGGDVDAMAAWCENHVAEESWKSVEESDVLVVFVEDVVLVSARAVVDDVADEAGLAAGRLAVGVEVEGFPGGRSHWF